MLFRSAGEPARWPPPVAGPVANLFSTACAAAIVCLLLAMPVPLIAQSAGGVSPVIRYHAGDNPQWAETGFDDSGWPVATQGQVPSVAGRGNGFLWVRMRVPVTRTLHGPLALHLSDLGTQPVVWRVFVNGVEISGQGTFPPQAKPAWPPVVVGDVSGKGLPAAMTVSAMIGALRTMAASGPAEILRRLNDSLLGTLRSGFVTCLCARIESSGTVTVANAGHPAPYRSGQEIALQPGLPLGIVPEPDYAETTIDLAPGEKLTFLSDGVVEARSTSGELFGFERARAVSGQAADEIASTAQRFGQEDDITVLTVALAAVP